MPNLKFRITETIFTFFILFFLNNLKFVEIRTFKIFFMSVIIVLIIVSFGMATSFLLAFLWAMKNNQFDDWYTPSVRILFEDNKTKINKLQSQEKD